jgi:hypothetical protein
MKETLKYQDLQGMKGLMLSSRGQRVHLASTYKLTYFMGINVLSSITRYRRARHLSNPTVMISGVGYQCLLIPLAVYHLPLFSFMLCCDHRLTAWGVQRGRRRPQAGPPCRRATPETAITLFQGWPPARHRRVGHGGPG